MKLQIVLLVVWLHIQAIEATMMLRSLDYHQASEMFDFIQEYALEVGQIEQWGYDIVSDTRRDFDRDYEAGRDRGELTRGARQGLRDTFEMANLEMVPSQKAELERRFEERFGLTIPELYPKWRRVGP